MSIPIFLLLALLILTVYSRCRGIGGHDILRAVGASVRTVGNILFVFLLIGVLTALWRASGCIPFIVSELSGLISSAWFLPLAFLMNVLVAVLTGTAFGTAATMGAITMSIAHALGASPLWTGGAILSGCYFGDRWSPVSTSALLVATLTKTDLYGNLRRMLRTTALPLALTVVAYWLVGRHLAAPAEVSAASITGLYAHEFSLNWLCALPAAAVVLLAACRLHVRWILLGSVAVALVVAMTIQHSEPLRLLRAAIFGFQARNAEVAALIDGGGLVSMVRVTFIVFAAAILCGVARAAGLFGHLAAGVLNLAIRFGRYTATLCVALITSAIACNQTLAIMLTQELTSSLYPDRTQHALDLEDSAVVVTPLIPWAIASAVVLDSVGAPLASISAALFLLFLPLCRFGCRRESNK